MANISNRQSMYSNFSAVPTPGSQSTQVSTQTLLNSLHSAYKASRPYSLDVNTSLVINTWLTATYGEEGRQGGVLDGELAHRVLEHARRRFEDGCILLGSLHNSTPSLFAPFIAALPLSIPAKVHTALLAIKPFLHRVTPLNPSAACYSAFSALFETSTTTGSVVDVRLRLSKAGIDTKNGLLHVPAEPGNRAFDVFYYLLGTLATPTEKGVLGLKEPSRYELLRRSQTYDLPSYLPTADDDASADEFHSALKEIGITGRKRRNLLSALAAILKLGDTLSMLVDGEELASICEDVATIFSVDPEVLYRKCSTQERELLVAGLYEALVDWVIAQANDSIAQDIIQSKNNDASSDGGSRIGAHTPLTSNDPGSTTFITVLDVPDQKLGKAIALRTIFDDNEGINAEMKEDGLHMIPVGHSVLAEMRAAVLECELELDIRGGQAARDWELHIDARERALDKLRQETDEGCFIRQFVFPDSERGILVGEHGRFELASLISSNRMYFHLSLHPTDEPLPSLAANPLSWSAGSPSRQLRSWRLAEWANRRNKKLDFSVDFEIDEFQKRFERLGCTPLREGVESFALERGWSNGELIVGHERVWVREPTWIELEDLRDTLNAEDMTNNTFQAQQPDLQSVYGSPFADTNAMLTDSRDQLIPMQPGGIPLVAPSVFGDRSIAHTNAMTTKTVSGGDYGLGRRGDEQKGALAAYDELDPELSNGNKVIVQQPIDISRRMWVSFCWIMTFWIPSFLLRYVGRMKRPDVRMAWREKVVLCFLIFLLNAAVVFYIVGLGRVLCPNFDKVWNLQELSENQGPTDFYVSVRGRVYDISHFWQQDHSGIVQQPVTSAVMQPLAGQNCDPMFPIPLNIGCPGLVTNDRLKLVPNITAQNTPASLAFTHASGYFNPYSNTALDNPYWYNVTFMPRMAGYYKGDLVFSTKNVSAQGTQDQRQWVIINSKVYDLTDYFYTQTTYAGDNSYHFLGTQFEQIVQNNAGSDVTGLWNSFAAGNSSGAAQIMTCLSNVFYVGATDVRDTPKCMVNNYILLAFTCCICAVILVKFLSALQLGSKRRPAQQDKFVICQVPCYTEGEDHLRKGLDSLTATAYDNKRKLICVICDGVIVGGGNDRPTPKIVLDILGVDPKIDPPALPFKSVGQGSDQLNYGKVYSGLYEFEGNVVPYIVVVKVGKESEQKKSKPGNRGKRDSQVLLLSFLNRVHHRSPMSPLELEMFHQINNIIGVDPELYEYLFMVDADTSVKEDALNRLVASCANDAKIAGICGETSLENEERSWWTMIQVYEYYISHHLVKAFESLFGSVTCLPGCFCMYRLRTADKGKPLIISDKVINEYADINTDTLHKKNLLALGEDRFLTTLMTKHFHNMMYKFTPDAYAKTAAPDTWSILLSQRRRWINSTVHNIAELIWLKDMCGFCCFSMRFVVFIDLFGTLILPATCCYLGYLIYTAASHNGQFPLFSIIILAAVYGLQAIIFIIKRQWQHVGWMIIYLIAFPIYSFVLPVYSFWKQDDFSWGNTRIVLGEKGNKQVIAVENESFDPRSIPMQRWDDYAAENSLPGRRGTRGGNENEKADYPAYDTGYEMDDMRSVYSAAKPASTILTGFKNRASMGAPYVTPQSPAPFTQYRPQSVVPQGNYPQFQRYTDQPSPGLQGHPMSMQNPSEANFRTSFLPASQENLLRHTPSPAGMLPYGRAGSHSPGPTVAYSGYNSRAPSVMQLPNFQNSVTGAPLEPSDVQIAEAVQACLAIVDLDTVTKKQLRALTEQRLQTQLGPERKAFLDRQIDLELANM